MNELLQNYIKDYFEKTGRKIKIVHVDAPDYEEVGKYVNNYICKYNVILGCRKSIESDKIHLLRWVLSTKFNLTPKEVAHYTKSNRTTLYNSLKVVNGYLEKKDEKFLELFGKLNISQ